MNPKEIYTKNDDGEFIASGVWFCGKCKTVPVMVMSDGSSKGNAEKCCKPKFCKCGKEIKNYHTRCQDCLNEIATNASNKRYGETPKICLSKYKEDMVYSPDLEKYIDIDDIECHFDENADLSKERFFGVCKRYLPQIDFIEHYEESVLDDFCDDGGELLVTLTDGVDDFKKAQEALFEANSNKYIYNVDSNLAVIFPNPEDTDGHK